MTLVDHVSRYAPQDWVTAIETLAPEIHSVDLHATRVWFAFFPLELAGMSGLADRVATSHTFLYGHRYWPQVKRAILAAAKEASWPSSLAELMVRIADHATRTTQVDRDQLIGITGASLMTLRQAGMAAFEASSNAVQLPHWAHVRSVRQTRRARVVGPWRPFAFLGQRRHRMRFSEAAPDAFADVADGQPVAACRGGDCRECVIGVISGAEKLSPIDPAVEGQRLGALGYGSAKASNGSPLIRLACQAKPSGDVSFVRVTP
ncbi:MAG: 2Fe-2S iron-sulfur cluster binding domain-containing protein [Acidobacteria bacterium]|nr:2Fe-2S iron-sulfur cluster binding domain-containing protein [Acidobacteriota bacterium]